MMNVVCKSCDNQFEVPLTGTGKIDYERCKNVFRVSYRYRTPCPQCKRVLQLAPNGQNRAVGLVLNFDKDEKTEAHRVTGPKIVDPGATLPRELASQIDRPPPTVRVAASVPTQVKPFRFVNQPEKRQAPLHVAVKSRRSSLPVLKIFLSSVVALGTAATVVLTTLAFRSGQPEKIPPAGRPKQERPLRAVERGLPRELPDVPQGGPEDEDADLAPRPAVKIKPAKSTKPVSIKIPAMDKLTSGYGVRLDPFSEKIAFHGGLDFRAEYRSEVKAALDGKVRYVGRKGSYGNLVIIEHAGGYESRYAHLSKALIKTGKKVKQGELIGLAGSTGRSTGTHIHFELRKDGKLVDPLHAQPVPRKS